MEQDFISQTALDQMVGTDETQFMKAAIPYLPPAGQQIFSIYAKAMEFSNTLSAFSKGKLSARGEMRAAAVPSASPLEVCSDIRRFLTGRNRQMMDQMINMMATVQMLQLMNEEPQKEDRNNE